MSVLQFLYNQHNWGLYNQHNLGEIQNGNNML